MPLRVKKIVRDSKDRGRGIGGRGAKSGRGMKGQKARAGYKRKKGFEGGQTPLYMRLPKGRGTKQKNAPQGMKPEEINVRTLHRFAAGCIVGPGELRTKGYLNRRSKKFKLIGNATLPHNITVRVHAVTSSAKKAVEDAGGKVEIIEKL